jgi:AcrR family transcriptional regulator
VAEETSINELSTDSVSVSEEGEPTQRKERRDAAEHRRRILVAARDLFTMQGVDATSMHEIARVARVGQGTLYRRYAHKGELCGALLADNVQRFQDDVRRHIEPDNGFALSHLIYLFTRLTAFNEENAPLLGAIVDAACGSRRGEGYRSPFYLWLRVTTLELLQRSIAEGEAAPIDAEVTVDALLAPFAIDVYLYQRRTLGFTPEQIVAATRQLLFEGLRVRGAGERVSG